MLKLLVVYDHSKEAWSHREVWLLRLGARIYIQSQQRNLPNQSILAFYFSDPFPNTGSLQLKVSVPQYIASSTCKFKLSYSTTKLKSATVKTDITCCVKAIHAVNTVPWHPGDDIHLSQTNKQTR